MEVWVVDPGHQVPYYDRALSRGLAETGVRVALFTAPLIHFDMPPSPDSFQHHVSFGWLLPRVDGVRHVLRGHPLIRRALRAAGYAPEMAAFVACALRAGPDVVHWQWSLAPPVDATALRLLRAAGCKVIHTVHNVLPHEARPWHRPAYAALYRAVDRLIVHSSAARSALCRLGIGAGCIDVVPMPNDSTVVPHPAERVLAKLRLGLGAETPLVLFFGHVRPYKGVDVLLDATTRLVVDSAPATVLIAGPVAGGVRGERRLVQAVDRRGLTGRVVLRLGYVPDSDVATLFGAADVVVLPYTRTDDSAVLGSARGYGRAVVATGVGGLPEALGAGGGIVVPPGDADALAGGLRRVLSDDALRVRLEHESVQAARSWNWKHAAERHRVIYRRMLGAPT